ncbi:MAG: hypothetical protein LBL43_06405 [Treponema sp.]|jgi:hypothetical protein|nr:hypothetical protein [Treponema sp.]
MRKFLLLFAALMAMAFIVGCDNGGGETNYTWPANFIETWVPDNTGGQQSPGVNSLVFSNTSGTGFIEANTTSASYNLQLTYVREPDDNTYTVKFLDDPTKAVGLEVDIDVKILSDGRMQVDYLLVDGIPFGGLKYKKYQP